MPGFDRTGPAGQGPMTGGRQGDCTGSDFRRGAGRRFNGRGLGHNSLFGFGYGFRHGFRNQNRWNVADQSEKRVIENEITTLKDQLSALEKRLAEIKD